MSEADVALFLKEHFSSVSPDDEAHLREACHALMTETMDVSDNPQDHQSQGPNVFIMPGLDTLEGPVIEGCHYASAGLDDSKYLQPNAFDDCGNPCTELYFMRDMAKVVLDDSAMEDNEIVVMKVLLSGIKHAVIQRNTDILTADELKSHKPEVLAAILEAQDLGQIQLF